MKVPLLDLKSQLMPIRAELATAILEVLDSTQYILGSKVEELELALANYTGAGVAIGVSSGTDALLLALMALDVGNQDLVITSDYSFFATAGAIVRVGAKPIFIDIDPRSFAIDPEALENWFENNQAQIKQVKAIIVVHLFGQCADMERLQKIATKYNIPIIEDAAQALGASYPSSLKDPSLVRAGALAEIACFSFFPSKNLGALGDAGIITCRDLDLAEKIKLLRNHGAKPKYFHKLIGGNFRIDTIQAAALLVKLQYLEGWNKARQINASYYSKELAGLPLKTPAICYKLENHIFNQYVITVTEGRDELRNYLKTCEIETEVYYPLGFHQQDCFKYLNYSAADFPNSVNAAKQTLAIPVYPELSQDQKAYVVNSIKEFYA